jgi:hypothetical protein
VSPKERGGAGGVGAAAWVLPIEAELHAVSPGLHDAQSAWLSQIDSLEAPDRKTHELIRMVCTVIRRNPPGVARHAMLAAEVGATWEEVAGSIMLTEPAFGLLNVVEALPWARRGWERGRRGFPAQPGAGEDRLAAAGRSPASRPGTGKAKKTPKARKAQAAQKAQKAGSATGRKAAKATRRPAGS